MSKPVRRVRFNALEAHKATRQAPSLALQGPRTREGEFPVGVISPWPADASWKLVLSQLITWADPYSGLAHPYVSRLARETCLSRGTVQRALRVLELAGHISLEGRSAHGGANSYRIHIGQKSALDMMAVDEPNVVAAGAGVLPGGVPVELLDLVHRQAAQIEAMQSRLEELAKRGAPASPFERRGAGAEHDNVRDRIKGPESDRQPRAARDPNRSQDSASSAASRRRRSIRAGRSEQVSAAIWGDLYPDEVASTIEWCFEGYVERRVARHQQRDSEYDTEAAKRKFAESIVSVAKEKSYALRATRDLVYEEFFRREGLWDGDRGLFEQQHRLDWYPRHRGPVETAVKRRIDRIREEQAAQTRAEQAADVVRKPSELNDPERIRSFGNGARQVLAGLGSAAA